MNMTTAGQREEKNQPEWELVLWIIDELYNGRSWKAMENERPEINNAIEWIHARAIVENKEKI